MIVAIATTLVAMFPGNLLAAHPIAVELEEGKGLRLRAPLKELYIPIKEIQAVSDSTVSSFFSGGILVQLSKRHGLLKSFIIDWFFGDDGKELARVLQREINNR